MPCYQVNLMSVELKAKNKDILFAAFKALGWNYKVIGEMVRVFNWEIDLKNERATFPDYAVDTFNKLKREYSKQVLLVAAAKKKWAVKHTAENKFQLRRY